MHQDKLDETLKSDQLIVVCSVCGLELAEGTVICPNDGTVVREQELSQKIRESYEILSVVGSGGMGVVYKARHQILNKLVAIKMLKSGHFNEASLQRLLREGRAASALLHPNIIATHDLGITEFGQPFMVMDYLEGISLAEKLKQGKLSAFLRQVGSGNNDASSQ